MLHALRALLPNWLLRADPSPKHAATDSARSRTRWLSLPSSEEAAKWRHPSNRAYTEQLRSEKDTP